MESLSYTYLDNIDYPNREPDFIIKTVGVGACSDFSFKVWYSDRINVFLYTTSSLGYNRPSAFIIDDGVWYYKHPGMWPGPIDMAIPRYVQVTSELVERINMLDNIILGDENVQG